MIVCCVSQWVIMWLYTAAQYEIMWFFLHCSAIGNHVIVSEMRIACLPKKIMVKYDCPETGSTAEYNFT